MSPSPWVIYDGRAWEIVSSWHYLDGETRITVPVGFRYDLASVPRFFWRWIAPYELSLAAATVHDLLYRHAGQCPPGLVNPCRTYTRLETDQLFRRIMAEEKVQKWRRWAAYRAVRMFGWRAWGGGTAP